MKFDFAKNQTVDSLDAVPSDLHGLYGETGEGNYAIRSDDPTVGSAISAINQLNAALKASRTEYDAMRTNVPDLAPLSAYGATPEEIASKIEEQLEDLRKSSKGKLGPDEIERRVEKIKADLSTGHTKDVEERDTRIQSLEKQLHGRLVSDEVSRACNETGGDAELVGPIIAQFIRAGEKDGVYGVSVVDGAGDERYSGVTGKTMTVKELVEEMKGNKRYAALFRSDAPSGGGAPTNQRPGGTRLPTKDLDPTQKIAAGLASGQYSRGKR